MKNKKLSLFELIYKYRFSSISTQHEDIIALKSIEPEHFKDWQKNKCFEIAKHHYKNSSTYSELVGDVFPDNWSDLPVCSKSNFQGDFLSALSLSDKSNKLYLGKTSGSTGTPFKFAKDYLTQARVWAYKKYFFQLYGIDFNSLEARFYRMPKDFKGRTIQKTKDLLLRRKRFPVNDMSEETFNKWIAIFQLHPFEYIYGYSSAIALFSKYLLASNIVLSDICPTLKVTIVTSETCLPEDKVVIQKATGLPVVNEYGTADVGLIGYECAKGNIHLAEENVFVETNDKGEILVTDLFNKAFPFIKFKLGDVSDIQEDQCGCGINHRYIKSVQGRVNDFILLENGKEISGYSYFQNTRPVLETIKGLTEYKIRQTALDTIEFDVVTLLDKIDDKTLLKLKETSRKQLPEYMNIKINKLNKIKRNGSGKLKHFERCF